MPPFFALLGVMGGWYFLHVGAEMFLKAQGGKYRPTNYPNTLWGLSIAAGGAIIAASTASLTLASIK